MTRKYLRATYPNFTKGNPRGKPKYIAIFTLEIFIVPETYLKKCNKEISDYTLY